MGLNITNHSLAEYNKAIVAVGSAVLGVAAWLGLNVDPAVVATVEGIVSSVLVFFVPNA
jgi:hypothetical protein